MSELKNASEVSPVSNSSPITTSRSDTQASSSTESKSGFWKYLIGCGLILFICCCLIFSSLIFAPSLLLSIIGSSNTGKDVSLTYISASEYESIKIAIDNKLDEEALNPVASSTLTEKEFLYTIITSTGSKFTPENTGIKIANGQLKIQFLLSETFDSTTNTGDNQLLAESTNDLRPTITVEIGAKGNDFKIITFSTGNSIFDSLITDELRKEVETSFSQAVNLEATGVKSIKLGEGTITIK